MGEQVGFGTVNTYVFGGRATCADLFFLAWSLSLLLFLYCSCPQRFISEPLRFKSISHARYCQVDVKPSYLRCIKLILSAWFIASFHAESDSQHYDPVGGLMIVVVSGEQRNS